MTQPLVEKSFPLVKPRENLVQLQKEFGEADIYSALVARIIEGLLMMEFNKNDRQRLAHPEYGYSLQGMRATYQIRTQHDGKLRAKGIHGNCFEYALSQAVNDKINPIYDRIALAYYRIFAKRRRIAVKSLSDLQKAGIDATQIKAVLFGAEKQTRYKGGILVFTMGRVKEMSEDASIYHYSANPDPQLVAGLDRLQDYYLEKAPKTRFGSLEHVIREGICDEALPDGIIGLSKADMLIGDPQLGTWICVDIKKNASHHEVQPLQCLGGRRRKRRTIDSGVYIHVSLNGKPSTQFGQYLESSVAEYVSIHDSTFVKMFQAAYDFTIRFLGVMPFDERNNFPEILMMLGRDLNSRLDHDLREVLAYLLQPVGAYIGENLEEKIIGKQYMKGNDVDFTPEDMDLVHSIDASAMSVTNAVIT